MGSISDPPVIRLPGFYTGKIKGRRHRPVVTWLLCLMLTLPPVGVSGAIDQSEFLRIIESLGLLYAPEFSRQQQRLRINGYWEQNRPEASAHMEEDLHGKLAVITLTGGLARQHPITRDAFALVICHEIGHFLAGEPMVGRYSTEGQSDYFAAASCLKRLLNRHPEVLEQGERRAPPVVRARCASVYAGKPEGETCVRTVMAGLALSSYIAYRKDTETPDFQKPDPGRARLLRFGLPTVQCRLDTFVAAALCNPEVVGASEPARPWLCTSGGTLPEASRPGCWYPAEPPH